MKVGLVTPYPWDVPGGVVAHVHDLADALLRLGHQVSVLAPVDDEDAPVPPYVVRAGRTVPVPYNGAVARLVFGPVSARRVRRWLREGEFDVLHLHSPETFSLSLLTLMSAQGPIVATFHAYTPRSRILTVLRTPLQTQLEKIQARIAVSPAARKTTMDHVGGDAVIIPNGVDVHRYSHAPVLPGWPGPAGAVGFVGRFDEPRKGFAVLGRAWTALREAHPGLRLLVAGPGDVEDLREQVGEGLTDLLADATFLGVVSDEVKAQVYRSVDVYVAPNVGGESFGIVLLEAMAAGTPVVASDLEPFRRVLDGGRAGRTFPVGDADALAGAVSGLLGDPAGRARLAQVGAQVVARYDWSVVANEVVAVYETAVAAWASGVRPIPGRPSEDDIAVLRGLAGD